MILYKPEEFLFLFSNKSISEEIEANLADLSKTKESTEAEAEVGNVV